MQSRWYHLKDSAISLRKNGSSLRDIEKVLGVPRSTLSSWLKDITLSAEQKVRLQKSKEENWALARKKAARWHRQQKALRLLDAENAAKDVLEAVTLTPEILDIAFAMLYLGEGAKSNTTSIANSNPEVLRFVLAVLKRNYNITHSQIRCDLHLRVDQNAEELKQYWSRELSLPLTCFRYVAFDKRSYGKPTYSHYKGVCVINCGTIAIQRKMMYLYTLFCEKVSTLKEGV